MSSTVLSLHDWPCLSATSTVGQSCLERKRIVLVSDELLATMFPPDAPSAPSLLKAWMDLRASTAKLEVYVADIEQRLHTFKKNWKYLKADAADIAQNEPFPQLDEAISRYKKGEEMAAKRLFELRFLLSQNKIPIRPEGVDLFRRLEDFMVDRCEVLRDIRWDLMAIRANVRTPDEVLPIQSLADLRRLVSGRSR